MNQKNLILTPTANMTRAEWLAFRQPLTHIKKFVVDLYNRRNKKEMTVEKFFAGRNEQVFSILTKVFKTKEWLEFKFPVIGGSEIASIMGLNQYQSSIELFYEKVGLKPVHDIDNAAMFWGRELEAEICDKWQYWSGNPEEMIENYKTGNIIRKCRRLKAYVQNVSFPWVFVSLDRLMNKRNNGIEIVNEGVLEAKTISGWTSQQWESGFPPSMICQLQTQILVCELVYGELAILKDGRWFEVLPFDKHEGIHGRLLKESLQFFMDVKYGCSHFLLSEATTDESVQQWHVSKIDSVAPEPDGSASYQSYLSERYKQTDREVEGGEEHAKLAMDYKYFKARAEEAEAGWTKASNKLKAFMKDAHKLTFPGGSATWRENEKGTRAFRVYIKLSDEHRPDSFGLHPPPVKTVAAKIRARRKVERKVRKSNGKGLKKPLKKPPVKSVPVKKAPAKKPVPVKKKKGGGLAAMMSTYRVKGKG